MIERAGTEVAMMLIGSSGTDAPSTARRSSFGARPSLFGFAADGSDPDRTVYSTYDQGLLAQLLPYYIESVSYHPSGMTKEITHAKRVTSVEEGAKDTRTIADTMMARPESIIATPKSGAERSSGTYQYDGAGNIKAIGSDTYTYDKVSRLVGSDVADATSGTTMSQDATYDGYSNLTNIRRTIGAANPEDRALPADTATNRLTIGTYDHAGNQTALTASFAPNQTYTYDPLDQMRARSVTGSRSFVYLYDADGERVAVDETTTGTTRMLTLRGLDGKVLRELRDAGAGWAWAKDYVYRGGTLLASVSVDGGIRHYHLDHLSTPRLHTDRCGAIAAELKSFPYGESAT